MNKDEYNFTRSLLGWQNQIDEIKRKAMKRPSGQAQQVAVLLRKAAEQLEISAQPARKYTLVELLEQGKPLPRTQPQ